jgi:ATP sulfurylase
MDLSDHDLLDLLLQRSELPASLDRPEVCEVLMQLRRPATLSTHEGMTP